MQLTITCISTSHNNRRQCELGCILGSFHSLPYLTSGHQDLAWFQTTMVGGVLFIIYVPAPPYISINDFIDPDDFSLSYCTTDDTYDFINQMSPGTLLGKIDLKDALILIPVHLSQWNLSGICWKTQFYVDTSLPSGARSAPYLFNNQFTGS